MKLDLEMMKTITILYVEDEIDIMTNTLQTFSKMFKKVHSAVDGKQGLEIFIQYQNEIDIVVSDINMPIKNGMDMIIDILKIKYIPTIITTAHTDKEFLLNSIDLGIDRYITKPVKIKELVIEIYQLVSAQRKTLHMQKVTETLVLKTKEINQERKNLQLELNNINKEIIPLRKLSDTYISIIHTNKQANITDVSTKFCKLYGYTKDEIIGKNIVTIQDDNSSNNEIQKYMLEAIHQKKSINTIHNFKTKKGKKLECDMIMTPHFASDGYIDGYTFYQDLIHI